eukprot:2250440-Amphidinium_carterae.1
MQRRHASYPEGARLLTLTSLLLVDVSSSIQGGFVLAKRAGPLSSRQRMWWSHQRTRRITFSLPFQNNLNDQLITIHKYLLQLPRQFHPTYTTQAIRYRHTGRTAHVHPAIVIRQHLLSQILEGVGGTELADNPTSSPDLEGFTHLWQCNCTDIPPERLLEVHASQQGKGPGKC